MCGIVGYMTKIANHKHKAFFAQALYADGLRGMDGTGVVAVNERTHDISMVKKGVCVNDFMEMKSVDILMNKLQSSTIAIGHNRAATQGSISSANSHPFHHGNFWMVHNGTLRSTYALPGNKEFDVDSEMICHSFSTTGVKDTLKKLNGAFALVWYNSESKTLNMVRNDERPLYIGYGKDNKEIFFASEGKMVEWIAHRNGIELETVESLPVGTMYTFHYEGADNKIRKEVEHVELYTFQKATTDTGRGSSTNTNDYGGLLKEYGLSHNQKVSVSFYEKVETQTSKNTGVYKYLGFLSFDPWAPVYVFTPTKIELNTDYKAKIAGAVGSHKENNVEVALHPQSLRLIINPKRKTTTVTKDGVILPFQKAANQLTAKEREINDPSQWIKGPSGKTIVVSKFKELTKFGCSNCGDELTIDDADSILWTAGDNPICSKCHDVVRKLISVH